MNGKLPSRTCQCAAHHCWRMAAGACACHTVTGSEAGLTGDCPPSLQGTAGHQPDATVGWCHQLADMARLRCVERRFEACGNATGPKDMHVGRQQFHGLSSRPPACNARTHTVFGSVSIKVHTAIALLHATVQACMSARACCNAHACLPESAVRAHCRRHYPGRWITANHPVYHP